MFDAISTKTKKEKFILEKKKKKQTRIWSFSLRAA
jgi:hypothetical protein